MSPRLTNALQGLLGLAALSIGAACLRWQLGLITLGALLLADYTASTWGNKR